MAREHTAVEGSARIRDSWPTRASLVSGGARTGSVEALRLSQRFLEGRLGPVVADWDRRGVGWRLPSENGSAVVRLIHVIWGDNAWFFGRTGSELQGMLDQATAALLIGGVRWKPEALEVLWGAATLLASRSSLSAADLGGPRLPSTTVEELKALGAWLTPSGETRTHQTHRARQAMRTYLKH